MAEEMVAAKGVGTVVARAVEMEAATAVAGEAATGTAMAMGAVETARAGNRPPRLRGALEAPSLVHGAAGQPAALRHQSESATGAASRKNLPTTDT
ncbi:hypothetical protein [Neorhizobium alkalisoli]|uniref:hypothetical protein n=1 Tax=Neorhizobium alkalisoli TaxID=528178 RepID=UPI00131A017D|nr:hypothetical protein [Neorhizobium alkalisoli]